MLDPAGTVGALGDWANRASLGTLAVTAPAERPRDPAARSPRAWASSSRRPSKCRGAIWSSATSAGAAIQRGSIPRFAPLRSRSAGPSCDGQPAAGSALRACRRLCASGTRTVAVEHSARAAARRAHQRRDFPRAAGQRSGAQRDQRAESLLRAICQQLRRDDCRGPTAAQAEFRTNRGTWPRVGGLLLIVAGRLGMLLLLGFLALRLLAAAIFSLAVPDARAGGGARAGVRRRRAVRSFAAGPPAARRGRVEAAVRVPARCRARGPGILEHLQALGWWTQWLLMSAFWWGLFARRHQVVQFASGAGRDERAHGVRRPVLRRVNETLDARARMQQRVRSARRSRRPPPSSRAKPRIPRAVCRGEVPPWIRPALQARRTARPSAMAIRAGSQLARQRPALDPQLARTTVACNPTRRQTRASSHRPRVRMPLA